MNFRNEVGYLAALFHLYSNGTDKVDRTGVGTRAIAGEINITWDLKLDNVRKIALPDTKKLFWEKGMHELLWMLSGSQRVGYLIQNNVPFWNNWVIKGTEEWGNVLTLGDRLREAQRVDLIKAYDEYRSGLSNVDDWDKLYQWLTDHGVPTHHLLDGNLGPVYGAQWRNQEDVRIINASEIYSDAWAKYGSKGFLHEGELGDGRLVIRRTVDQIEKLEKVLGSRDDCHSRRIILSAWNVIRLDEMALPPCHTLAQWIVTEKGDKRVLDCVLYQRSGDFFLGVPYNAMFYSMFTHMLAAVHDMTPGRLFHKFGDAHIYQNHFEQVREQLSRTINPEAHMSRLYLRSTHADNSRYKSVLDYKASDFDVEFYKPQPFIPAPVAV